MTVDLTFDFKVEYHFFWTGRFPAALMEEIGRRKNDIYQKLSPDLRRPDLLSGSDVITVEGRTFEVLFAADKYQTDFSSDVRPMRVIHIDER